MTVTPATIGTALGRTATTEETAQWQMWIDDALMLIDARKTDLEIETELDEIKLDYVVREAVVAHVRRPDNVSQVTVSVQDASTSKSYRTSAGRINILDEWWILLGLTQPTGGAFTIDTIGAVSVHSEVCALYFGALYCSCGADLTNYTHPLWEV